MRRWGSDTEEKRKFFTRRFGGLWYDSPTNMFQRQRKNQPPKDPEQMWREAFPDPKPPRYSSRAVIIGSEIGAVVGALFTLLWFIRYLESRYQTTVFEFTNNEIGWGLLFVGCLPGLVVGGLIGAFLGSRIPPKESGRR